MKKLYVLFIFFCLLPVSTGATHLPTTWYGWLFASSNQLHLRKLNQNMHTGTNVNQTAMQKEKQKYEKFIDRYNPLNPLDLENQPLIYSVSLLPIAGWLYERYQLRAYGGRFIFNQYVPPEGIGWCSAGFVAALYITLKHLFNFQIVDND